MNDDPDYEENDQFFEDLGEDFDDDFDDDFEEAPTSGYQTFTRSKVVLVIGHDGTEETKQALYAYMEALGADNLSENGPRTTTFVWLCGSSEEFQIEIKNMVVGICAYSKFRHSIRVEEENIVLWVSDN